MNRLWQWLSAVSRYRASCSPAPNFAFALVTRKTPPQLRDTLDLSCVIVRLNVSIIDTVTARLAAYPSVDLKRMVRMPSSHIASYCECCLCVYMGVRQSLICGAEPIRPEVMSAFFSHFASTGLKPTTLTPAYGLAEFTLCATAQVHAV